MREPVDSRELLYDALKAIVRAWESIPPTTPVPDEINDDALWENARTALEAAEVPDLFDEIDSEPNTPT